jgi:hypothetical protein
MAEVQTTRPIGNGAKAAAAVERRSYAEKTGEGWLVFAGTMFLLVAVFNTIWGIAALAGDSHLV